MAIKEATDGIDGAEPAAAGSGSATHAVFNVVPPLAGVNLYATHAALREGVAREGAAAADGWLHARGAELGSADMQALAVQANRHPPVLRAFDAVGRRRDEVEYHPAYHALMDYLVRHGVTAGPWREPGPGAQVRRAALFMMYAGLEAGTLCPATMTHAAVPALAHAPALAAQWLPRIRSDVYDPRPLPAARKHGVTLGMGMTEKQGGSDLRANTTRAVPQADGSYRIVGHKWFFSAPMSDAFLVLAQAPGGLSCLLVPRWLDDGAGGTLRNDLRLQRLKDKLGDRANAGSEVEFWNAQGWLVGTEGRGIATILDMGTYCRLDCVLGSAGLTRQATIEAIHHARHRQAFGRRLAEQPLMRNVLADLALESEAATALSMRLARTFDARDDEAELLLSRLLTPAAKYWVCKRGPALAAEAMEVLGGNGYVEDGPLARIYRQMPLNSIWEGSGNVMCLDVLRAVGRDARCLDALHDELAAARGANARFDAHVARLFAEFDAVMMATRAGGDADGDAGAYRARALARGVVLAVQAGLLLRFAPAAVADAFCASRFGADGASGDAFGQLPPGVAGAALIDRAWPD